ncbi:hypothetical protein WJX74_007363 [Apatococcus lobatus]|uniref:Heme O synthase n=1 Tax=Apatococcus lobatus TaxID=904363 RepID=A0AAW1QC63_9CHLO
MGLASINVWDEQKGLRQTFQCELEVLLSSMRYFRTYLRVIADHRNIQISVHCDVLVFSWLLQWAKAQHGQAELPKFSAWNCLQIMISSEFLQMEHLVAEAGAFAAANLQKLVSGAADLGALSEDLLAAIACRTSEACLEQLHACLPLSLTSGCQPPDPSASGPSTKSKPHVSPYQQPVHGVQLPRPGADKEGSLKPTAEGQQLGDESQSGPEPPLRTREGGGDSPSQGLQLTTAQSQQLAQVLPRLFRLKLLRSVADARLVLCRCLVCGIVYPAPFRHKLICSSRAPHLVQQRAGRVRVGSQQRQHVPDRIWRWQAHCERLAGSMPWRKVFWSQWGCLHVLHCSACSTHFQARHLNQCWFHPDPIQSSSTGPGHYGCCGRLALGARGALGQDGCCSQEHSVDATDPLVQVLLIHRHLIMDANPASEAHGRRKLVRPASPPSESEQDESQMIEEAEAGDEGDHGPEEETQAGQESDNEPDESWHAADERPVSPSKLLLRDSPVKKAHEGTTQLAGLRAVHVEHANPFLERALRLQLVREGDELQMNSLIGYLSQIRARQKKQAEKETQNGHSMTHYISRAGLLQQTPKREWPGIGKTRDKMSDSNFYAAENESACQCRLATLEVVLKREPLLLEPGPVLFQVTQPEGKQHRDVRLRNIGVTTERFRLLAPPSPHFSMSMPAFPQEAGYLRPGLVCSFRISFQPDALRNYTDQILVERQESAGFSIPISAGYHAPRLTLPASLDLGPVHLGAARGRQIYVRNLGGPGTFMWEQQEQTAGAIGNGSIGPGGSRIPAAPARHGISHKQRPVQAGPFLILPGVFHLDPDEGVIIGVMFQPETAGQVTHVARLIFPDGSQQAFTLHGHGVNIEFELLAVPVPAGPPPRAPVPPVQSPLPGLPPQDSLIVEPTSSPPQSSEVPAPSAAASNVPFQTDIAPCAQLDIEQQQLNVQNPIHEPEMASQSANSSMMQSTVQADPETAQDSAMPAADQAYKAVKGQARMWMGEVTLGVVVEGHQCISNHGPLPLPFEWVIEELLAPRPAATSAAGPPSAAEMRLSAAGSEADSLEASQESRPSDGWLPDAPSGLRDADGGLLQSGDEAPDEVMECPFDIQPAVGDLAPAATTRFSFTCRPTCPGRSSAVAHFRLRLPGHDATAQNSSTWPAVTVALEACGVAGHLEITPSQLMLPQPLNLGQVIRIPVEIFNPTNCPAQHLLCNSSHPDVCWEEVDSLRGIWSYSPIPVAPMAGKSRTLRVQPRTSGRLDCLVSCHADHGGSCSMQLTGHVEGPSVRTIEPAIDFGEVWQDQEPTATIHLKNESCWARASWTLKALQLPVARPVLGSTSDSTVLDVSGDELDQSCSEAQDEGFTDSLNWLHLSCTSGILEPNASTTMQVPAAAVGLSEIAAQIAPTVISIPAGGSMETTVSLMPMSVGAFEMVFPLTVEHSTCPLGLLLTEDTASSASSTHVDSLELQQASISLANPEFTSCSDDLSALSSKEQSDAIETNLDQLEHQHESSASIEPAHASPDPGEPFNNDSQPLETLQLETIDSHVLQTIAADAKPNAGNDNRTLQTNDSQSISKGQLNNAFELGEAFAGTAGQSASRQSSNNGEKPSDSTSSPGDMITAPQTTTAAASSNHDAEQPDPSNGSESSGRQVIDFGNGLLRGSMAAASLELRNESAVGADVSCWLDTLGASEDPTPCLHLPGRQLQRRASVLQGGPLRMKASQEQMGPFSSHAGRAMSAAKQIQATAMLLGQEQGVAVCIRPATFPLGPFATCTIHLSCYAARAGLYEDVLHLQVGDLPLQDIAMRVHVANDSVQIFKSSKPDNVVQILPNHRGSPENISWPGLGWTVTGTFCAAACANTLNQVYEVLPDGKMKRTNRRPLPTGRLPVGHALAFAAVTGGLGVSILASKANSLTAGLGAANIGLYAGIYTPLKALTPVNTWVGAVVGAVPPLMGWAAASGGRLDWGALVPAAALYFWQLPHFLAIAWLCRADYARGGFRMLSLADPLGKRTARAALRNALYLMPLGALATAIGLTTPAFTVEAAIISGALASTAASFYRSPSNGTARLLFRASLLHLPILLACLLIHRIPNQPPHLQPSSQQLWARLRRSLLTPFLSTSAQLAPPGAAASSQDGICSHSIADRFGAQSLPVPFPFLPVPLNSWHPSSSSSHDSSQTSHGEWLSSSSQSQDQNASREQHAGPVTCNYCQQPLQSVSDQNRCSNCRHPR